MNSRAGRQSRAPVNLPLGTSGEGADWEKKAEQGKYHVYLFVHIYTDWRSTVHESAGKQRTNPSLVGAVARGSEILGGLDRRKIWADIG